MKYIEFIWHALPMNDIAYDLLAADLGEIGFESFIQEDDVLKAYVQDTLLDMEAIDALVDDFALPEVKLTYTHDAVEDKNWNEEWEKNYFQPIVVGNRCVVHSTFHKDVPEAEYAIVINPQMSFGTGHHSTTSLVLQYLLDDEAIVLRNNLQGGRVLDMGCGTSILGIMASKRGALSVFGVDIDEHCIINSEENVVLNHVDNLKVQLGDATSLAGTGPYNVVVANINRNILLNDMKYYVAEMADKACLIMSGFYTEDVAAIQACAEDLGLKKLEQRTNDNWAALLFVKK